MVRYAPYRLTLVFAVRYENDLKDVEPDILLGLANFYDTTVDDFLLWNALIKSPDYPMNVNKLRLLGKLK